VSGYSLADILRGQLKGTKGDVSNLDTFGGREQIEYISIDKIDGDPKNFYQLSGLEELAANIELLGLQQPLRVRANPDAPNRVIVVSGHRRLAVLKKLVEEGREELREVPCIRERTEGSAALQELRLIYANSGTRVLTSAELSRQAERVELLLYQLKEEGMEFPGRMRDHVAEACKISAPKLARLKVIRENLAPAYMELFDKDKLPERTAYALARLPLEFQQRMASALPEVPSGNAAEKVLAKYNEGWRWEPELSCPDGKPCKRGDAFLRRDCEAAGWQSFCGGQTCCLECEHAKTACYPCERMCSKAKAQRKAEKDEAAETTRQRRRKQGRPYQKETQGYAKRLLRAIDAAGLAADTEIPWAYHSQPVSTIRQWAAGEFDDPADWYSSRLKPSACQHPVEVAKLLNCSTDFLMGLTDELRLPAVSPQHGPEAEPEGDASEEGWDELPEALDTFSEDETPDRLIRWEGRGRTPPVGKLILTYQFTNDGPVYRPAVWAGGAFKSPNGKKTLTGLQFTHWLEIPAPGGGDAVQIAPLEKAEGQLVICGWMPGGTLPREPCDVVADFLVSGEDGRPDANIRNACWFDGEAFRFKRFGCKIDAECVRWMFLPPVEDVSNLDTSGEADA